ncbi:MAG TPA: nuclear transport factor 2 family protein [Terriglobales bacterium]|jgi:hypothetical protein
MWHEKPAVNSWSQATGGESLERSLWKEIHDKNWNELERHIGGTYMAVTPHGCFDRSGALQRFQQLQLDDYSLGDFEVELNGNTLVVTYAWSAHGNFAGHPLTSQPVRMMSVWQQQKTGWMMIAHAASEGVPE